MDDLFFDQSMPEILRNSLKNQFKYDPRNVIPDTKVKWGRAGVADDALAYVHPKEPNTIRFNRFINAGQETFNHLMPHEFEHVLQQNVSARYPQGYDTEVIRQYAKAGGKGQQTFINNLMRASSNTELSNHLTKLMNGPIAAYLGNVPKKLQWFDLQEQFAELSAMEQKLNKDLTKDVVVRKHFFNDDQAMIDAYKATTGLRTNRLDAKDLPPMTVPDMPIVKPKAPTSQSYWDKIFG